MIKRLLLVLFSGLIISSSDAQLLNDLYKLYDPAFFNPSNADSTSIVTPYGIIKPGKTNYNLSFGTGYTSFGSSMGLSNSYISPSVSYSPTEKLHVIAGATISYNSFHNLPDIYTTSNGMNQLNTGNPAQVYAFGHYQVSNKLSIFAIGSVSRNQLYFSPYQSAFGKVNYNEFGVGFNYKLGSKTTIGASFNFSNAPYSFGNNSLYRGNYGFPY